MEPWQQQVIASAGRPIAFVYPPSDICATPLAYSAEEMERDGVSTKGYEAAYPTAAIISVAQPFRDRIAELENYGATRADEMLAAAKRIAELEAEVERLKSGVKSLIPGMVSAFLGWELPKDFAPDNYIRFDREWATAYGWPSGTNLLHAGQAEKMFSAVINAAMKAG